ncbi:MAG TPA: SusE domain-containing protein [Puia sp.]|jgi:hypothetical protein
MKKIFSALFITGSLVMVLAGCQKNMTNTVLNSPGTVTGFTVSANSVALSSANDSQTVVKFNWQAVNYGYSSIASYTLLVDQPSDTSGAAAWGNAVKVPIQTGGLSQSWLGTDFNHLLNQLGLTPGVPTPIVIRLKADVNQSTGAASTVPTLHSDLAMTVTAYKILLIYPKLYVAGDFLVPNWTQIDQPGWVLSSVKSDGSYEGFLNFPNAGNNFKLCTQLAWNGAYYGWGGTATTLSGASSAGNCYSAGPGYSKVVADVNALTISYTPTSWVIAGDFNNWSVTANKMTFNATTNQWTATGVNLVAGKMWKFVGDAAYNTCFGLDAKGNFVEGNGSVANFTTATTGTYTVTLDLSQGNGNYTYSVK